MNSKKNSFKRVAAGALAVLTVAAYTTPVANVGGLLNTSLVAEAATKQAFSFEGLNDLIQSIKDTAGTSYDAGQIANMSGYSVNLNEGATATIKSVAPLSFKANGVELTAEDDNFTSKKTTSGYTYTFKVPKNAVTATAKTSKIDLQNGSDDEAHRWGPSLILDEHGALSNNTYTTQETVVGDYGYYVVRSGEKLYDVNKAYQNETIYVYAENYFTAYYWNEQKGTKVKETGPNYDSENHLWVAKITAFENDATDILIGAATPKLTYTASANVLKVTGSGIDSTVASVTAKSVPWDEKKEQWTEVEGKDYTLKTGASAQKFNSKVTLSFAKDPNFVNGVNNSTKGYYATLSVTRNGSAIDDYDLSTTVNDDRPFDDIVITASGKYVVTYTVWVETDDATVKKEMKFNFTIATKGELTAKNVAVTFHSPVELADSTYNGIDKCYEKTVRGDSDISAALASAESLNKKTVTVTAVLYDGELNANGTPKDGVSPLASYTVSGSEKVSTVNSSQTLTVTYDDPMYTTTEKNININWKVTPYVKQPRLIEPSDYFMKDEEDWDDIEDAEANYVTTSIDEIDSLQKKISGKFVLVNGSSDKLSYEYVTGKGASLETEELDEHVAGLPSKVGAYSVFVLYDGEALGIIYVDITEHSLYAKPTKAQLNLTYGKVFMNDDTIKYVDSNGTTVKDAKVTNVGIKAYKLEEITTKEDLFEIETYIEAGMYEVRADGSVGIAEKYAARFGIDATEVETGLYKKNDKYYFMLSDEDEDVYYDEADLRRYPLPAGEYAVKIYSKTGGNKTKVGKSGYSVSEKTFLVSVAQKKITSDMFLITPKTLVNGKATITNADLTVRDLDIVKNFPGVTDPSDTEISAKIASGITTGKKVGENTCVVAVADDEENYYGSEEAKWYIVKTAELENSDDIEWDDNVTTIKDNGSVYVKFSRDANLDGEVTHFGVICEKFGKLDAPEFDSVEEYLAAKSDGTYWEDTHANGNNKKAVEKAYKCLVYGGSIWYHDQTPDMIKANGEEDFGLRINVSSVDVGAWVRPYLIVQDKDTKEETLVYGEVRYLDLVDEVTNQLNLKAAPKANGTDVAPMEVAVSKDEAKEEASDAEIKDKSYRQNIVSGYREDKAQFYVYGSYNLDPKSNMKEDAIQAFGLVIDKNGVIKNKEDAFATLKLGAKKGFIEGKADKNNTKMDRDEFGAVINPANAVTGVWIREYVDFGNGLVVYTDPVYIKSVSEQYANLKPAALYYEDSEKAELYAESVAYGNGTIVKTGMVADISGKLLHKKDDGTYENALDDLAGANAKFIAENASENGYISRSLKGDEYSGRVTQLKDRKDNPIPIVERAYTVYTIEGKTVTVYGDIYVNGAKATPWNEG